MVCGGRVLGSGVWGELDGVDSGLVKVAYRRIHRRRPSLDGWKGALAMIVWQGLGADRARSSILG